MCKKYCVWIGPKWRKRWLGVLNTDKSTKTDRFTIWDKDSQSCLRVYFTIFGTSTEMRELNSHADCLTLVCWHHQSHLLLFFIVKKIGKKLAVLFTFCDNNKIDFFPGKQFLPIERKNLLFVEIKSNWSLIDLVCSFLS